MNRARIETNRKNMELARSLLETAFEDLKNVDAFRNDIATAKPNRDRVMGQIDLFIQVAKEIERKAV